MCQVTGCVFPEQTGNFTAISFGHNAVLFQDTVTKILGTLRVPHGIASSTTVKGRNVERRKNQEKTFQNLNNYMSPYICISSQVFSFYLFPAL